MDKLTVFDILAFFIPGAFLNGLIYYFLLVFNIDISIFKIEEQPIINSISFLGLSYVVGFVISEFAFHFFNRFNRIRNKQHNFSYSDIILKEFDADYLKKLSKYNEEFLSIKIYDAESKTPIASNIRESFLIWVETIAMHTTYALGTVLHGQFMLFRNLFAVFLLSVPLLVFMLISMWDEEIYYRADFVIAAVFCTVLIPVSYKIYKNRFQIYTKTIVRGIYSYFSSLQNKTKT